MILPALNRGGYTFRTQVLIGLRPGGRKHKIDVVAADRTGREYLISMKWQQTSGTAEQKVPFEVICLTEAIRIEPQYVGAYLVLGGTGWTLRNFYVGRGLDQHLTSAKQVAIVTLETFIAKANQGKL